MPFPLLTYQFVQHPCRTFFLNISWACGCHPSGRHDWQNTCPRWSSSCWPHSFSPCQHFSRRPGIDPWGLPYRPAASPSHTTRIIPSSANHIQRCASVVLFMERHSFCSLNNWSVSLYFFFFFFSFYSASGCNRTLFSLVMSWSLFCSIFAFASLQFTSGWKWAGACKQMSRWLARGSSGFFLGFFWTVLVLWSSQVWEFGRTEENLSLFKHHLTVSNVAKC